MPARLWSELEEKRIDRNRNGRVRQVRQRLGGEIVVPLVDYAVGKMPATAKQAAPVKKWKMSAAGRKRIAEATKKRWADLRAKTAAAAGGE